VIAEADLRWMEMALDLAARGRHGASPNPMVGSVVVDRHGELAGTGYHAAFGAPHAERNALQEAGVRAVGGTLYVTLEPCNHHGKTPPCSEAILESGITRVVIAAADPNPEAGGGAARLQAAGVEVEVGALANEARHLNRRWLRLITRRRPWVTLKAAISLDGRIATRTGESQWITGEQARQRSLELREEHDAILVGIGTVLADDPRLTRRLGLNPVDRWRRIIVDSNLRTPADAVVVSQSPEQTLIAHTASAPKHARETLQGRGVNLLEIDGDRHGRVDMATLLDRLGDQEVAALLVEGGATVTGSLVDQQMVDEVVLFIAPMLIGGPAPSVVAGAGAEALASALKLCYTEVKKSGEDLEIWAVREEETGVHRVD
jgi:diaminohydroxyphosphoribosylaminopyrimidine deaminase/5-amino-6-(5-phosphoribosylamino)uracil reductase